MDDDAKELWSDDELAVRMSSTEDGHVHDALHRHIGAIGRRLRSRRAGLPIHAASCILSNGLGVLLPGETGAGKSTLCLALGLERDASVISDDTVWFGSGTVVGFGSPFAVRATSPHFELARRLWYADSSERLLVQPEDLGAPRASDRGGAVSLCVFAEFGMERTGTRRLSPAEAFCRASGSLLRVPSRVELEALAILVGSVPCVSIAYSDTATALRLVDEIADAASTSGAVVPQILDEGHLSSVGMGPAMRGVRFGGDVALWNAAVGSMVYITNWTGDRPLSSSIVRRLQEMNILEAGV